MHLKRYSAIGWDGYAMMALTNICLFLTLFLPLIPQFLNVLKIANRDTSQPQGKSNLVVFGKKLSNGKMDEDFIARLSKVLNLHERQKIYILGGATVKDKESEASVAKNWLVEKGVTPTLIFIEENSVNTLENLQQFRDFLPTKYDAVVFISNNYHLARIGLFANRLGLVHEICGADDKFSLSLTSSLQILIESYLIFYYRVGEWYAIKTNNAGMLKRIH